MSEHIISDEFIKGVRDASYEAGKAGLESYIVGVGDNEEVIRCRDHECAWLTWPVGHGERARCALTVAATRGLRLGSNTENVNKDRWK